MAVQDGGPINYTEVLPSLRLAQATGAGIGVDITVTGITTNDYLPQVNDITSSPSEDLTDTFTITGDDTLQSTVDTTALQLQVLWLKADLADPGGSDPLFPANTAV